MVRVLRITITSYIRSALTSLRDPLTVDTSIAIATKL